ncbi:putative hydrolase of the HAD superfamily [Bacillus niacini]|uniref:Hydrolase of the HAD superfamily n=1 Tax=Neobacillus niacini TaxID=86668 RepID=A0A852TI56_9BACI|nr:HAD family hydrolase [Neobacillus niacini]NYE08483.1 putative hydrolase of the HAD superfamily [Neobacillus niacini]
MNQQTLILDLDDTLIHCNKYFEQAKNEFVKKIKEWIKTPSDEEIKQKQLEIDLKSVEIHGLLSEKFPETLIATYFYFCQKYRKGIKANEVEQVRTIGRRVFETEVEPLPYMYDVLNQLQQDGHQLYLFTGGDVKNQTRKIRQLALEPYFQERVYISQHKNSKALQKVINKIPANKNSIWMIGNSLKTDIMPAIELGLNAIHIPSEMEWSYNIVDLEIEQKGTFAELTSLLDLPVFFREYAFYNEAM